MQGSTLITRVKQVGARVFERMLTDSGVDAFNGAQGNILRVLWQQDGLPIRELSRQTGLAMATLTGMLDRMENSGLIRRDRGDADRRKVLIYLTERAKALEGDFNRAQEEMYSIYYKGFESGEIQRFEKDLARVLQNVEDALVQRENISKKPAQRY